MDRNRVLPMDPIPLADVIGTCPDLAPCLVDTPDGFKAFFERFSPYRPDQPVPKNGLAPHSQRIVESWWDGRARRWRDQIIVNVPPRHAKSEVIIWFCIWRIVLDRSVRIILVSKTHVLAQQAIQFISRVLTDPAFELTTYFGPFRPEGEGAQWLPSQGILDVQGKDINQKEVTLRSRGSGMQIQGLGADWFFGDDVATFGNSLTTEQRDKLQTWWQMECMTRIEPDGHTILNGTRVHPDDLYGRLLSLVEEEEYLVAEGEIDEPLWHHVMFPALADPVTGAPSIAADSVPLWPERWPAKKLQRIRVNSKGPGGSGAVFAATYQQHPAGDSERVFKEKWFDACYDESRGLFELHPEWPRPLSIIVAAIDPSPTMYAAGVLAQVSLSADRFTAAILDIERRKMTVEQMKQVIDRWHQIMTPQLGLDYLIFEANAAQRWFINDMGMREWCNERSIRVIQHQTYKNKTDEELGFSSMAEAFEFGRVRFPMAGPEARTKTAMFRSEAVSWTSKRDLDDQLMALWFIYNQFPTMRLHSRPREPRRGKGFNIPAHLRADRNGQPVRWVRARSN